MTLPCARCGAPKLPGRGRRFCGPCKESARAEYLSGRRQKLWQKQNPEKAYQSQRRTRLKKLYGLTLEQYDEMLQAQDGRCAICRALPSKHRLAVDHDHACCHGPVSCGRCVRGLLCNLCNRHVLPWVENDAWLTSALAYLALHRGQVE